jgi:serine protease Do
VNIGTQDAYYAREHFKSASKKNMRNPIVAIVALLLAGAPSLGQPLDYDRRTPVVNVVEKISPSVVTIKTDVRRAVRVDPFASMGFRSLFNPGVIQERTFSSAGSGVIVDREGHVITNAHVVADAKRLTCITFDGEERPLTLIGVDAAFDIAVLRIDRTNGESAGFGEIDWGTTSDLMMGETILVTGSALSFENSVSVGIVSAVERTVEVKNREPYFGMIQTDAAINRGNSGGPLVNIRGELIGVTTLIATEGGGSDGIGFAIPVERVRSVYNEFVNGIVSLEERLGIELVNPQTVEGIHDSQRERLGLPKNGVRGLLTIKLHSDGLAAQSGLREGDLLIDVNGRIVPTRNDLQRVLEEQNPTAPLLLTALRVAQQTGEVSKVVIEVPTGALAGSERIERVDSWFGFEVTGIGNDLADSLRVSIDDGVVITTVQPNSPAYQEGFARGDMIQSIGPWRIQTVGDFRRLRHVFQNDETVRFQIRRGTAVKDFYLSQPRSLQGKTRGS